MFLAWWENKQLMTEGTRLPGIYLLGAALIVSTLGFSTSLPARWHYEVPLAVRVGGIVVALAAGVGLLTLKQASARVRGLLGATVALVVVWMFIHLPGFDDVWASGPDGNRETALHSGFALLGALSGWILALGWMADPNALSLHTFYKMRLVRAYLGASNKERRARSHDIAEPDPERRRDAGLAAEQQQAGRALSPGEHHAQSRGRPRPGHRPALGGQLRDGAALLRLAPYGVPSRPRPTCAARSRSAPRWRPRAPP